MERTIEPLRQRRDEYMQETARLREDVRELESQKSRTTSQEEHVRIDQAISLTQVGIKEHETGLLQIRQSLNSLDQAVEFAAAQLQKASDDEHNLETKRQRLAEDLSAAERDAGAATDKARHAQAEVDRLQAQVERQQEVVDDCRKDQEGEEGEDEEITDDESGGRTLTL
jgi:chromosome segregation ATPase